MSGDPYEQVLGMLATMRSAQTMTSRDARVYRAVLDPIPIDELREVVWRMVRTETWRPAPAEVLQAVAVARLELPDPHEAWERVERVVSERKGWGELPGPVKRAAEYVGGPWGIRSTEQPHRTRQQFVNAYEEFRRAAVIDVVDSLALPQTSREELAP